MRFDGSLTFINVAYFEDIILEAQAEYPDARVLLVVGSGINEIDASEKKRFGSWRNGSVKWASS